MAGGCGMEPKELAQVLAELGRIFTRPAERFTAMLWRYRVAGRGFDLEEAEAEVAEELATATRVSKPRIGADELRRMARLAEGLIAKGSGCGCVYLLKAVARLLLSVHMGRWEALSPDQQAQVLAPLLTAIYYKNNGRTRLYRYAVIDLSLLAEARLGEED